MTIEGIVKDFALAIATGLAILWPTFQRLAAMDEKRQAARKDFHSRLDRLEKLVEQLLHRQSPIPPATPPRDHPPLNGFAGDFPTDQP